MTGFFHTIVPGVPGRPVGGNGFTRHTTYVQNNFYGSDNGLWSNSMNYGARYNGNSNDKLTDTMIKLGLFSTIIGAITDLFGGSKKDNIPDNSGSTVKNNPNNNTTIQNNNNEVKKEQDDETPPGVDLEGKGADEVKKPEHEFDANEMPQEVKTYSRPIQKGDTWYHIVEGYYKSGDGSKLSNQEILAIVKELRAQYVDGGHVEDGKVLDSNNQEVDVSRMDLPRGEVKLPETLTINGKEYTCNGEGSVKKVEYGFATLTGAGNYNAKQIAPKWQPTVDGNIFGKKLFDSKDDAVTHTKTNYKDEE